MEDSAVAEVEAEEVTAAEVLEDHQLGGLNLECLLLVYICSIFHIEEMFFNEGML